MCKLILKFDNLPVGDIVHSQHIRHMHTLKDPEQPHMHKLHNPAVHTHSMHSIDFDPPAVPRHQVSPTTMNHLGPTIC